MAIDPKYAPLIRKLIPLNTMPRSLFDKLCTATSVEQAPKGTTLFQKDDDRTDFVYLLAGKIRLEAGGTVMERIEGGGEAARFALAHQVPRKVSAVAESKIHFIWVQAEFLYSESKKIEKKEESSGYQVSDIPKESAGDWMTALLRLPIFQQLPASNLQKLLMELETVRFNANDVVIPQGSEGEYYFIIKKGRCALSRKPTAAAKEIIIAKLKQLDTFGEDALITGEPSQISATMTTDGVLWRIDQQKFLELIKAPIVSSITLENAQLEAEDELAFIDVRPPIEFDAGHLVKSINIPFFSLPMQVSRLDKEKQYVMICSDGKTSDAAVFYLIRRGLQALTLEAGLEEINVDQLVVTPGSQKTPTPQITDKVAVKTPDNGGLTAEELRDPLYLASLEDVAVSTHEPEPTIKEPALFAASSAEETATIKVAGNGAVPSSVDSPIETPPVVSPVPSPAADKAVTQVTLAEQQVVLNDHIKELSDQIAALKFVVKELVVLTRQQQQLATKANEERSQ